MCIRDRQDIRDSLYRRYASGEVSRADFHEFKRIFTRDCEEVERAIEAQQQELDRMLELSLIHILNAKGSRLSGPS